MPLSECSLAGGSTRQQRLSSFQWAHPPMTHPASSQRAQAKLASLLALQARQDLRRLQEKPQARAAATNSGAPAAAAAGSGATEAGGSASSSSGGEAAAPPAPAAPGAAGQEDLQRQLEERQQQDKVGAACRDSSGDGGRQTPVPPVFLAGQQFLLRREACLTVPAWRLHHNPFVSSQPARPPACPSHCPCSAWLPS